MLEILISANYSASISSKLFPEGERITFGGVVTVANFPHSPIRVHARLITDRCKSCICYDVMVKIKSPKSPNVTVKCVIQVAEVVCRARMPSR